MVGSRAVPWSDDELNFDGCCCSGRCKKHKHKHGGGSWVPSGGRRLAEVGKSAEMRLLVGARIKSCYNGREARVLLLTGGKGAVIFSSVIVAAER